MCGIVGLLDPAQRRGESEAAQVKEFLLTASKEGILQEFPPEMYEE